MTTTGGIQFKGFTLSPFQQKAAAALREGRDVLVAAPTGAGKTLVAEYAIHRALERGQRAIYTAPIKALSNQKFRDFRADPEIADAGLMTGDVTLHPDARVLVMTTEILRNTLFEDPAKLHDVGAVVFDEIHYMDDVERGSVWEETLIFLKEDVEIVGLSATIANLGQFAAWLEKVRKRPMAVVEERKRPVPLKHYLYHPKVGVFPPSRLKNISKRFAGRKKDRSWHRRDDGPLLDSLEERELLPTLYFCFSRKLCERKARQEGRSRRLLNKSEAQQVLEVWAQAEEEFGFDSNRGSLSELKSMTVRGVAAHHAGMLPLHKEMVERLFTSALLRLLFTTETFAMGINMPAKAVVFDSLEKFDGVDFDYMRTRDYLQMAGRAGRLGMDKVGSVYSVLEFDDVLQAPIHRIQSGKVEPVISRFDLDYGTLVHLHEVAGDAGAAEAWERSFAAFQSREHSKQREERNRKRMRALIAKRYRFLDSMAYISGEREVKARGRVALGLHGYEIHLTELLFEGVFDHADPAGICAVIAGVIHEGRKRQTYDRRSLKPIQHLMRSADRAIQSAIEMEMAAGLQPSLKRFDVGMSPAIFEYALGREFEDLADFTSAAGGDFVRIARMTVQYLRHLKKVCLQGELDDLAGRLEDAVGLIYRGPVDVRAELGLEEKDQPE
ncbi:MAG TPA: DEAD/DEAH box helicase [Planctomycetota bacterium]|jgi:superfamily II RNA helicase|nr:hypothetical protein [Planctomycetota bacterium]MDP7245568.1 DEAD/DEAH box helicase [Planctomycetota bacterium]HJM38594.1 DEAD/DEAH box helicase [Planctomycetota bacterium]|tara:strand:- start:8666 stop:10669 length:2004 start_codon:yes stop_codon:yes gene_type:complete